MCTDVAGDVSRIGGRGRGSALQPLIGIPARPLPLVAARNEGAHLFAGALLFELPAILFEIGQQASLLHGNRLAGLNRWKQFRTFFHRIHRVGEISDSSVGLA